MKIHRDVMNLLAILLTVSLLGVAAAEASPFLCQNTDTKLLTKRVKCKKGETKTLDLATLVGDTGPAGSVDTSDCWFVESDGTAGLTSTVTINCDTVGGGSATSAGDHDAFLLSYGWRALAGDTDSSTLTRARAQRMTCASGGSYIEAITATMQDVDASPAANEQLRLQVTCCLKASCEPANS